MDVAALFHEHHGSLVRYLNRLTGDPDLANDAAQEAFLRIQERPPGRSHELRAWLFRVDMLVPSTLWSLYQLREKSFR